MRLAFIKHNIPPGLGLMSAVLYGIFAYRPVRTEIITLLFLYGALFFLFYLLVRTGKEKERRLTGIGIGLRAVFLFALPNLSQDFYRFIWDGELLLKGINPYLYLPDDLVQKAGFSIANMQELYEGMGALSASHYSNYPPLSQFIFALASVFSGKILGAVILMRLLLILADLGVLYFGRKLLRHLKLPEYYIFWYFLNPFILIELTGNLHFEGVMLFFLLWSLYALLRHKLFLSATLLACAVSVKLIPLLFLPLFLHRLGWKKLVLYGAVTGLAVLLLFLPFWSEISIHHYKKTLGLWFTNFEFNASWYYLLREAGFGGESYPLIRYYGRIMPWVILVMIMLTAFFRHNKNPVQLITAMLLALSFYYFTATTVHPWYIALLIGLSVFTRYRFPLVWSAVIMLSYEAYSTPGFRENLWLIALEYTVVYGVMARELFLKRSIRWSLLRKND